MHSVHLPASSHLSCASFFIFYLFFARKTLATCVIESRSPFNQDKKKTTHHAHVIVIIVQTKLQVELRHLRWDDLILRS